MLRESIVGLKDPYDETRFTPPLITPDMNKLLASWRVWSTGDNKVYFGALDVVIKSAEDRSVSIMDVLENPEVNRHGNLLKDDPPMLAKPSEMRCFTAAVSDAIGIGQYLLGHQHPDFPANWTDMAPVRHGRIGAITMKALSRANRGTQKSLEEIDKRLGVDIDSLFTAATSVAWQYIDTFESDALLYAVLKMSALPREAKKEYRVYKHFDRWSRRLQATTREQEPNERLRIRGELFNDIMTAARSIGSSITVHSRSPAMADLNKIVQDYDAFIDATEPSVSELVELIDIYERERQR